MSNDPILRVIHRIVNHSWSDPVIPLDETNVKLIGDALVKAGYIPAPTQTVNKATDALQESERKCAELFEMNLRLIKERDEYANLIATIEGPAGFGNCSELHGLSLWDKVQKVMKTVRVSDAALTELGWIRKILRECGIPSDNAEVGVRALRAKLEKTQDELNVETEKRSTAENELGSEVMELNNDLRDAIRLALWAVTCKVTRPAFEDRLAKTSQLADKHKVSLNDSEVSQDSRVSTGYLYLIDTLAEMQSKPKPKTNTHFGDLPED